MANTVNINDLDTLSPSAVDDNYYGILFTADGDTNKVVFEDAVSQANANNGCLCLKKVSFEIAAADVLNLNATPQYFLPPLGADTYPDFVNISVQFKNGTTPYATNVDLEVRYFGSNQPVYENATILNATNDCIRSLTPSDPTFAGANLQVVANTGVYIWSPTGAPTAGDFDLVVHATYVEVNIA